MGLLNVLAPGTYAHITLFHLDRTTKHIQFDLTVYSDRSLAHCLFKKSFSLSCKGNHLSVDSVTKRGPLEFETDGNYYYVPNGAIGAWKDKTMHFAQIINSDTFFIKAMEGQIIFCKEDKKHYTIRSDGSLQVCVQGSKEDWDKYFDNGVSTNNGANHIQQCYNYLRDRTIFPEATDA